MLFRSGYQIYRYTLNPNPAHTPQPQPALGRAIREARQERGETLRRIAAEAGIALNTLSLIERGEANPTWETVKGIAAALDVPISELAKLAETYERKHGQKS